MGAMFVTDAVLYIYKFINQEKPFSKKMIFKLLEKDSEKVFASSKKIIRYFLVMVCKHDEYLFYDHYVNDYKMVNIEFIIDEKRKYFYKKPSPTENEVLQFFEKFFSNSNAWADFLYQRNVISEELYLSAIKNALNQSTNSKYFKKMYSASRKTLNLLTLYHEILMKKEFEVDEIMKKLKVSRKTAKKYLAEINVFLG